MDTTEALTIQAIEDFYIETETEEPVWKVGSRFFGERGWETVVPNEAA